MFEIETVLFALMLATFAGLSTVIGSFIAFFVKATNTKFLALSLGFSAGVMVYVSFVEILPEGIHFLSEDHGEILGYAIGTIALFSGILIAIGLDKLIPTDQSEEVIEASADSTAVIKQEKKELKRVGVVSAIAVAAHNFPEGIATFMAAIYNPVLGFSMAIAVALHNIPEGVAVSMPIYHATGSKKEAFLYSALSGLAEPLGAIIAYLFLMPFLSPTLFGVVFSLVAGIMIYISFDELLPAAKKYSNHHVSMYAFLCGMFFMAISLLLLLVLF